MAQHYKNTLNCSLENGLSCVNFTLKTNFKKKRFLMWTIFKVFIELVTTLFLFYVLVFWPQAMWDLNSSTRD